RLVELVVVAPLSLALVTLTSLTLFYARLWSLHTELWLVGGLCLAGLISSYFCSRRQPKGI
ncbi:MAG: hypothetical protein ACXVCO_15800, partial [Ktedonobacterales bacterium]